MRSISYTLFNIHFFVQCELSNSYVTQTISHSSVSSSINLGMLPLWWNLIHPWTHINEIHCCQEEFWY